MYVDRLSSLACLISVRSDRLLSCSLFALALQSRSRCICLSHSVDSSALNYTVRNLPSYSVDPSHRTLSTCATLKCTFPFVQSKFSVYGLTYADRHTYTRVLRNAVTLVWGSLRLAPIIFFPGLPLFLHILACKLSHFGMRWSQPIIQNTPFNLLVWHETHSGYTTNGLPCQKFNKIRLCSPGWGS